MSDQPLLTSRKPSHASLDAPRDRGDRFHPGRWLDHRRKDVASLTAISGCYERNSSASGGWKSRNTHYFDMCLGQRPASSFGRFVNAATGLRPLGDIFFVPAGHRYVGEGGPGQQRNLFVFLKVDNEFDEGQASPAMLDDCVDLQSDRIKVLLTRICRELYEPGFASELLLEGLGITLLAETVRLLQYGTKREHGRGGLSPRYLRMIEDRVREGESLPSMSELAELCQLSRRHLMRAFREETGQTVGAFVQNLTMEKARHLLQNTDQPVGLIASAVGFTNPSAFSTAFRRATGESPRSYRTRQKALSAGFGLLKESFKSDQVNPSDLFQAS